MPRRGESPDRRQRWPALAVGTAAAALVIVGAFLPWFGLGKVGVPLHVTGMGRVTLDRRGIDPHYLAAATDLVGRPGVVTIGLAVTAVATLLVSAVTGRATGAGDTVAAVALSAAAALAVLVWFWPATMMSGPMTALGAAEVNLDGSIVDAESGLMLTAIAAAVGAVAVVVLRNRGSRPTPPRASPRST